MDWILFLKWVAGILVVVFFVLGAIGSLGEDKNNNERDVL